MASCSATVPVFHRSPTWKGPWERRRSLTCPILAMSTVHPSRLPTGRLTSNDRDQPFNSVSTGSSEDADLVAVQSGEDWIAKLDDDLSQPAAISGDSFRISNLQREDPVCITLHSWIVADAFPPWAEVKSMLPWRTPFAVASPQQFISVRQRYLVAQEKFICKTNIWIGLTALGPQGRLGTALLVLPCFLIWWSSIGRVCLMTSRSGWLIAWRV